MKENEIQNTTIRVQYWLAIIKRDLMLQECESAEKAIAYVREKKFCGKDGCLSPLDEQCFRHAVEVSPIRCPLTESTFK